MKTSFHVIHIHTQVSNSKTTSLYLSLCYNCYISISIIIEISYTARHEPRTFNFLTFPLILMKFVQTNVPRVPCSSPLTWTRTMFKRSPTNARCCRFRNTQRSWEKSRTDIWPYTITTTFTIWLDIMTPRRTCWPCSQGLFENSLSWRLG